MTVLYYLVKFGILLCPEKRRMDAKDIFSIASVTAAALVVSTSLFLFVIWSNSFLKITSVLLCILFVLFALTPFEYLGFKRFTFAARSVLWWTGVTSILVYLPLRIVSNQLLFSSDGRKFRFICSKVVSVEEVKTCLQTGDQIVTRRLAVGGLAVCTLKRRPEVELLCLFIGSRRSASGGS